MVGSKINKVWHPVHSNAPDDKIKPIHGCSSDSAGWQKGNRDLDDVIFHHPAVTIISWGIFLTTVLISDYLFIVIFFNL